MKKILFATPLLTNLYFYNVAAQELNIPIRTLPSIHKIYVFGDSLSDTGNLSATTLSFLPSSNNYFMGRFSNGYLWIDNLAVSYHTTVQDNQFIKNYSVAGATAFPYVNQVSIFHWGYYLVGSLGNQLYDFTKTYKKFKPDDLVIVWIGANDLLWAGDMYFCGKLTKACIDGQVEKSDQNIIIQRAVNSVKTQIQKMEKKAAQHIILMGLPDFSIIPRYIYQQHSVSALKKADVKSYNYKLKAFVKENQSAGHNILFYDFNRFLEELIHDKAELTKDKITDVVHSCLYRNQEPTQYWKSIVFNHYNPLFMYAVIPVFRDALSDPNYYTKGSLKEFIDKECGNNYIFWDSVHPTKKGHLVIAQHLLTYIHNHFNLSRAKSDVGYCYNLQVINKGWFILDVSQKNNICGPENTYLLKNNEKLVSVEFNKPVKFKAILGKSITFSHLPYPIQGLGAKIECTGTTITDFCCKQTN